jgi:hypothetical protein
MCRNSFERALQKGNPENASQYRNQNEFAPAVFFSNMEGCAVSGTTLIVRTRPPQGRRILPKSARLHRFREVDRKEGSKTQR